jgi:rare lipoprotein A
MRRAALVLALLLAGCAHAPPSRIAPPANLPDLRTVPDAVPHAEPRSALGNPPFYAVAGQRYVVLASAAGYLERGVASWYGPDFHGGRTATGEPYDMYAMTAAHKTLPIPCYARVTNLSNGRSVIVRINDRGPFVAKRIIDLSYTAALRLDMIRNGTAFVQVEAVGADTGSATAAGPSPASGPVAAADAAVPAAAPIASTFYVQVGAYANADNARRATQRLRTAGFANAITLAPPPGQLLQRVRLGPIASVAEFDAVIERLGQLGFADARLAQD